MNTTGWNMAGDAHVTDVIGSGDSEMLICYDVLNSSGAVFYNQPINLSFCVKWTAEFDFRMYDGTGADGIAFCFLDVPPTGYVVGGGLGIPDGANGLKVCFDTWNNCIPYDPNTVHQDMPKIEIRWEPGYNINDANNTIVGECINMPTRDNSDGKLSYIRSPNYNHAKITYDSGNIAVYVNDTLYLTAYQQFTFKGYLGFTASTGGYTDDHSIKNVIIYTQMPPSFAGNKTGVCPYDTVQLGGPSNPSYTYTWSPPTGLSDTTVSAPLLHLSNDSANSQLHTYYVRTGFSNNPGCSSLDSVTVKVYPNPQVNYIMPKICLTDAIGQFYDSSYTGDSSTLPFTYEWNFGDPYAQASNPNNSTAQNPTHRYSAAANYQMSLAVTSSQGCTDSASKIFTVNGTNPKADFTVLNPTGLCSNQAVQLSNNSTVDFGSIVKVKIFWGDTSTVSYSDTTPYPGKIYSHLYPNPVSSNTTTYTIRMISYSGITCQDEMDQQVTVQPSPHTQFNALPTVCSYDSPMYINQAVELTGLPGSSSFFGRGISTQGLFSPPLAGAGIDTLLYTYTATNGCTDSAYQNIYVQAPPLVNAGNDTAVVINQPLQLNALSSDFTEDAFSWSPIYGLNDPGIPNPVAIFLTNIDSIRYTVRATDTVGCYGEATILVKVFNTMPDIFMPNAFTPGKNINTIFRPICVGITSLQYFRIYNRWGQLVYSTSQLGAGWDGSINGKPQATDGYVWTVQGTTYTGKIITKKGTMTLIR